MSPSLLESRTVCASLCMYSLNDFGSAGYVPPTSVCVFVCARVRACVLGGLRQCVCVCVCVCVSFAKYTFCLKKETVHSLVL